MNEAPYDPLAGHAAMLGLDRHRVAVAGSAERCLPEALVRDQQCRWTRWTLPDGRAGAWVVQRCAQVTGHAPLSTADSHQYEAVAVVEMTPEEAERHA